jgi:hypothetical protein
VANGALLSALLVSCLAYFSILKVEAICSSHTSVDFNLPTLRYIPEETCVCGFISSTAGLWHVVINVDKELIHELDRNITTDTNMIDSGLFNYTFRPTGLCNVEGCWCGSNGSWPDIGQEGLSETTGKRAGLLAEVWMQKLSNMNPKSRDTTFSSEIQNERKEISAWTSCAVCSCHSLFCPFVLNLNYMNFIPLNLCWAHNRTLLHNSIALFWNFYTRDILTMKATGLTIYWCFRLLIERAQILVALKAGMFVYVLEDDSAVSCLIEIQFEQKNPGDCQELATAWSPRKIIWGKCDNV